MQQNASLSRNRLLPKASPSFHPRERSEVGKSREVGTLSEAQLRAEPGGLVFPTRSCPLAPHMCRHVPPWVWRALPELLPTAPAQPPVGSIRPWLPSQPRSSALTSVSVAAEASASCSAHPRRPVPFPPIILHCWEHGAGPRARDDQDGTMTPPSSAATSPLCPRALPQVRPDISLLIYSNSLLKAGRSPVSIPDNLT